jgi:ubiquinone/menaquinone biosynthesis C-methylase UbiE
MTRLHILDLKQLSNPKKRKKVRHYCGALNSYHLLRFIDYPSTLTNINPTTILILQYFLSTVYSVFENVADSYDKMNDAMSFGIHRLWKDTLIQRLDPQPNCRLLDCAGGTGDIAFRYLTHLRQPYVVKTSKNHVTVLDINENMLEVGKVRAKRQGFTVENNYDISWVQGNAEDLPCENESYTAYTIAFGIRNVTHIDKVQIL